MAQVCTRFVSLSIALVASLGSLSAVAQAPAPQPLPAPAPAPAAVPAPAGPEPAPPPAAAVPPPAPLPAEPLPAPAAPALAPAEPPMALEAPASEAPNAEAAAWYERITFGAFADAYFGVDFNFPKAGRLDPSRRRNPIRAYDAASGFSLTWVGLDVALPAEPVGGALSLRFGPAAERLGGACADGECDSEVGLANVKRHTGALARSLAESLRELTHHGGAPLVRVYGPEDHYDRGATIAFNVLDRRGATVPHGVVEERARARRISLRAGCFCNPGASETALAFDPGGSARCIEETRRAGWTLAGFAARMRQHDASHATGAVRASFGVPSNASDVERLLELVREMRDD